MLLLNKTAVIYGGSGAVGSAVAKAYAREGALIFLAARRQSELEAVAAEIRSTGGVCDVASVDATDPQAVERHISDVARVAGPIKVMFNGSGWPDTQGEPLVDTSWEHFSHCIITALRNWYVTGTAFARHMAQNGGGVIVGISANAGREAYANLGGFGVTCAAIEHYLRQLAVENGPDGVRVCWVRSPGSPDAPGVREAWQLRADELGISFDELHKEFAKDTPLRRITALAQVADAAVLLASDLAAGMTATMANATGGAQVD